MLFRRKIAKSCLYCAKGVKVNDTEVLCAKRGIVSTESACAGFQYDPCKRIPPRQKPSDFKKFDNEDFSL